MIAQAVLVGVAHVDGGTTNHPGAPRDQAQTRTTAAQIADLLDRSTSMCDVLLATARTHPDDDAVRSFTTGQVWTYDELMARIGSVAQRLQGVGVGRGDTVALMMRNIPEFPSSMRQP